MPEEQEETKDTGLTMHRKMTLDFGDETLIKDRNTDQGDYEPSSAKKRPKADEGISDDGSRSMLTVETELMMPLTATECLVAKDKASVAETSSVSELVLVKKNSANNHVAEYVEELIANCLNASAYETDL